VVLTNAAQSEYTLGVDGRKSSKFLSTQKYVHQGRMHHFKIDSAAVFCKSNAAIGSSCVVFPFFKRASNMRLEHISDEFANFGWWRLNLQVI